MSLSSSPIFPWKILKNFSPLKFLCLLWEKKFSTKKKIKKREKNSTKFFGRNFPKAKLLLWRLDHNPSWNYQKNLLILEKYLEEILGGFVRIFEPANSGFRCRPVLILHRLKFRTMIFIHKRISKIWFSHDWIFPRRLLLKIAWNLNSFNCYFLKQRFPLQDCLTFSHLLNNKTCGFSS